MRIRTMANKVRARQVSIETFRWNIHCCTVTVYETVPYLDVFYHKLEYLSLSLSSKEDRISFQ